MISTDLQGPVSPHQDADCALLFVFQQLDVTGSSLLPLRWIVLRGKTIELSPPGGGKKGFYIYSVTCFKATVAALCAGQQVQTRLIS